MKTHTVCCENQAVEHRRSADSICPTDFIQKIFQELSFKISICYCAGKENLSKLDTGRVDTGVLISITKNVASKLN